MGRTKAPRSRPIPAYRCPERACRSCLHWPLLLRDLLRPPGNGLPANCPRPRQPVRPSLGIRLRSVRPKATKPSEVGKSWLVSPVVVASDVLLRVCCTQCATTGGPLVMPDLDSVGHERGWDSWLRKTPHRRSRSAQTAEPGRTVEALRQLAVVTNRSCDEIKNQRYSKSKTPPPDMGPDRLPPSRWFSKPCSHRGRRSRRTLWQESCLFYTRMPETG